MFNFKFLTAGATSLALLASAAMSETVIRLQSVLPVSGDEVRMVEDFAKDVAELTGGSLKIEILPAGAVVGPRDILDAVDAGLVEAGFAWTHYWGGKHPAANLFGAPIAGAGVGIDNIAFLSWFQYGGGKELYDRLWDEMGVNVKGFMLQPVGPEALGWFPNKIESLWMISVSYVSVHLQVWLALHIMKLALRLLPWVAVIFCLLLKKAQLMLLNGAVQDLTKYLASKKY